MSLQPKQQPPYYRQGGTKTLIALISQNSTSPPVLTILVNTYNTEITTGYFSTGAYSINLTGEFTENKTTVEISQGGTLATANPIIAYRNDENQIEIDTYTAPSTPLNGVLLNNFLKITTYV